MWYFVIHVYNFFNLKLFSNKKMSQKINTYTVYINTILWLLSRKTFPSTPFGITVISEVLDQRVVAWVEIINIISDSISYTYVWMLDCRGRGVIIGRYNEPKKCAARSNVPEWSNETRAEFGNRIEEEWAAPEMSVLILDGILKYPGSARRCAEAQRLVLPGYLVQMPPRVLKKAGRKVTFSE